MSKARTEAQREAQLKYKRGRVWLLRCIIAVAALSIIAIVVGAISYSSDDEDLWYELFRAGLTLFVATVVGGIVSLLIDTYKRAQDEQIASDRAAAEQARELAELKQRFLRDVVGAYNEVKAARRQIRALGLYQPEGAVTELQASCLRKEIEKVLDAELTFEALLKEVRDIGALGSGPESITTQLETAEGYLNKHTDGTTGVLDEWQMMHGAIAIKDGTSPEEVRNFERLQDFLAPQGDELGFRAKMTVPVYGIMQQVRQSLYVV